MKDEMCATLGGRAAEKVIFNKISTGALSDLEKVTKQARAMVTIYGLNDEIGNLTYYDSSGQNEYGFSKPYSEQTAQTIDKEISKLIEEQYKRAVELLSNNKDKLTELAERLLEKEVIFKDDLEKIFGKRPFERDKRMEAEEAAEKVEKANEAAEKVEKANKDLPKSETEK
jgi:cell division protease FtsH